MQGLDGPRARPVGPFAHDPDRIGAVDLDGQVRARAAERQVAQADARAEVDDVARAAGVGDGVEAVAGIVLIGVRALAALQLVVALAADQDVVAGVADQGVVVLGALQALDAVQHVARGVAGGGDRAVQRDGDARGRVGVGGDVDAVAAEDLVRACAAVQGVGARAAVDHVIARAGVDRVVAAARRDDVVLAPGEDRVVAVHGGDPGLLVAPGLVDVVGPVGLGGGVDRIGRHVDRAGGGEHIVLDRRRLALDVGDGDLVGEAVEAGHRIVVLGDPDHPVRAGAGGDLQVLDVDADPELQGVIAAIDRRGRAVADVAVEGHVDPVVVELADPLSAGEIGLAVRARDGAVGLADPAVHERAVLPDDLPVAGGQFVDHRVLAVAAVEDDQVVAAAGDDGVVALAPGEDVVAVAAVEEVVARVAFEGVVAGPAVEHVVTGPAQHPVVALVARDDVVARTAAGHVVAGEREDGIVARSAPQEVVAGRADHGVVARGAHGEAAHADGVADAELLAVGEAQPFDAVLGQEPALHGQDVASRRAAAVEQADDQVVARAREVEVAKFDAGLERDGVLAADHVAVDLVVAAAGPVGLDRAVAQAGEAVGQDVAGRRAARVEDDVLAVAEAEQVLVRALTAHQHVAAGPAIQDVAAVAAEQAVIAVPARQPVRARAAI